MASYVKGQINGLAADLLNTSRDTSFERASFRKDDAWVRQSFIVGTGGSGAPLLEPTDLANRHFSSAAFKYTDSSLGGNHCINPPPQFTRYADIRDKGLLPDAVDTTVNYHGGPLGQGMYYSEAIDDKNQIIHLRFGVPSYNSLTQFFTGFYNSGAATLARTGRVDSSFFEKFLGVAMAIVEAAILPLTIIPIMFMQIAAAVRYFLKIPASKFYYLKATMPVYWQTVSTMVNQLSVNMGLSTWMSPSAYESFVGGPMRVDNMDKNIFSQLFPDFNPNGTLDIYAIANRSKMLESRHRAYLVKQLSQKGADGWYGKVKKVYDEKLGIQQADPDENSPRTMKSIWERWVGAPELAKGDNNGEVEQDPRKGPDVSGLSPEQAKQVLESPYEPQVSDGFFKFFMANKSDGADWASFRVDYTGPVQESFSNSTSPSAMAQKVNSASAAARDIKIDMAGGNIDPLGIVNSVLSGVGSVLQSAADSVGLGGLAAFAGNCFVDIPDHWESHQAQLPRSTYTIQLVSPYGNPVSQLFNLYVPLCMLLAGTLPLMTGKQSYTSPFLCEIYDRGRCINRLGVIDSLSITRGTGNFGFNTEGKTMALDISFSVKDLSTIMAMPIQQGFSLSLTEGIFDSENAFTDYLMALSGMSLRDANDRLPILKRQLDTKMANWSTYWSASRLAMDLGAMTPDILTGLFTTGTDKK